MSSNAGSFEAGLCSPRTNIRELSLRLRRPVLSHDHFRTAEGDRSSCRLRPTACNASTSIRFLKRPAPAADSNRTRRPPIVLTDESSAAACALFDTRGDRCGQCDDGLPAAADDGLFVRRTAHRSCRHRKRRSRATGVLQFYHSDVDRALLNHPLYTASANPPQPESSITSAAAVRYMCRSGILVRGRYSARACSAAADGWDESFGLCATRFFRWSPCGPAVSRTTVRAAEGVFLRHRRLISAGSRTSLRDCGLEVTVSVFASLMRKVLQVRPHPLRRANRSPGYRSWESSRPVTSILTTCSCSRSMTIRFPGNRAVVSSFVPV